MATQDLQNCRIVHISSDFPDPIEPFKTQVIRSLVDLTNTRFDHDVISLNRRTPSLSQLTDAMLRRPWRPHLVVQDEPFEYGTAVAYQAPAKGLYHATMLKQLGAWIAKKVASGPPAQLLVGHKLAFEGIAVATAARLLGLPYALSIQGDSDTKVLAARPDLAPLLHDVFHGAAAVFPFSPWSLEAVERRLQKRPAGTFLLPCPTDIDEPVQPKVGGVGLITTFHLKNHARKNLKGLVAALRLLEEDGLAPRLTVVGGGSEHDRAQCARIVNGLNGVHFSGPMDRAGVREAFGNARGFIMPSLRESFGLVFIEALLAGLPIAYPAGTAVDGYLDGLPFALRIDARDPASIAQAMQKLDADEPELKARLGNWLRSDDCRRFTRGEIANQFSAGLRTALGKS